MSTEVIAQDEAAFQGAISDVRSDVSETNWLASGRLPMERVQSEHVLLTPIKACGRMLCY